MHSQLGVSAPGLDERVLAQCTFAPPPVYTWQLLTAYREDTRMHAFAVQPSCMHALVPDRGVLPVFPGCDAGFRSCSWPRTNQGA